MKDQNRVLYFNPAIPTMASNIEHSLYLEAPTKEFYLDRLSLSRRVCAIITPPFYYSRDSIQPCSYTESSYIVLLTYILIILKFTRRC